VFLSDCGRAFWVTSAPRYARHDWKGAWINSAFRSEGAGVASELIRQAVAATLAFYGDPPPLGMVTFINRERVRPTKVRGREVWGWSYRKAGFVEDGETRVHKLLALRLHPADMPAPEPALQRAMHGTPLFDALAS
jgi:hypothetical protein